MGKIEHTCDYKYISSTFRCDDCGAEFTREEAEAAAELGKCPECGEELDEGIVRNEDEDRFDEW